jgi:hypothetical protein
MISKIGKGLKRRLERAHARSTTLAKPIQPPVLRLLSAARTALELWGAEA